MTASVELRPAQRADAMALAQVRVDSWRTTYRGIIPDPYLDAMNVADSAAFWERILGSGSSIASVFVATENDAVVGFAAANLRTPPKLGFDAELSAIYLRQSHHRRGIGRRLVATVAAQQRERGATGLVVFVIAKNQGARSFYESLGGELLVEQPFQWDGIDLVEAGYGFRDLDRLAAAGGPNPALH